MEEMTVGVLTAQYITEPASWVVYAEGQNDKIADIRPQDWANEAVDFRSREAGQLILDTMNELRVAFLPAEAEMVKNDQGTTKDVPDTSPAPEPVPGTPEAAPEAGLGDAEEILELIKLLLDDVDANGGEPTSEHTAALNEAEGLLKKAIDDIMGEAEAEMAEGKDVTAKLARIETLLNG